MADEDDYAEIHYHRSGCGDYYPGSSWHGNTKRGRMWRRLHHGHPAKCSSMAGETSDRLSFQFNFPAKLTIFFAAPTDWRKQQERQPRVQCRRQPRWFLPRHTCLQLHQKLQWDQGEGGHKRNFLNWDYIFRFSTAWRLMGGAQWNIQQTPHSLQRNTKLFNLPATGNFDRLHFPYFPPLVPKNRG